jgi:hypothetical protein
VLEFDAKHSEAAKFDDMNCMMDPRESGKFLEIKKRLGEVRDTPPWPGRK